MCWKIYIYIYIWFQKLLFRKRIYIKEKFWFLVVLLNVERETLNEIKITITTTKLTTENWFVKWRPIKYDVNSGDFPPPCFSALVRNGLEGGGCIIHWRRTGEITIGLWATKICRTKTKKSENTGSKPPLRRLRATPWLTHRLHIYWLIHASSSAYSAISTWPANTRRIVVRAKTKMESEKWNSSSPFSHRDLRGKMYVDNIFLYCLLTSLSREI